MPILTTATDTHHQTLAAEYQYLSSLPHLNLNQEERLSYILDLAIQDSVLDQHIQNIELASLSPDDENHILDQQAKMREYLDVDTQSGSSSYTDHPMPNVENMRCSSHSFMKKRSAFPLTAFPILI